MIRIRETKRYGRGVYATRTIRKGEVVEVSPIVTLRDTWSGTTRLDLLVFAYDQKRCCLALGNGSLFNHSEHDNVEYLVGKKSIRFAAKRDIRKGAQLFIDYGYDPRKYADVWRRG